jgi:quercetin dioxygenase-like cupin family protein
MRISKDDIPVKISAPGAIARQVTDFGDADGYKTFGGEYFSMAAGTDISPLLQGLDHDACHSPHWGYMMEGEVVVRYTDGSEEMAGAGDLFYWPPGHTVRVNKDAEFVLFSPQHEHTAVMDHIRAKIGGHQR